MSEMIERLKAVICYVQEGPNDPDGVVRDLLEAMREPTEAMMKAAATIGHDACPGTEWEPMIDAALGTVDA